MPPGHRRAALTRSLLTWYAENKRDLPWRRTRDPYLIWVSEVMLQQTRVATVIPYFDNWARRFPTAKALARANESEVLKAWEGLGYYSRARRLQAGAREVSERHRGRVPETVEELRALPGVGRYTAGAISSIAFGHRTPVVDGNVVRVLTRVCGLRGDPNRAQLKRKIWDIADALVVEGRASESNQALMELGSIICTPKAPECSRCPWTRACIARRDGAVSALPETSERKPSTPVRSVAGVVYRNGRVLISQLPEDAARWAGLWHFPATEPGAPETPEAAVRRAVLEETGVLTSPRGLITVVKFSVTRFRITLDAYRCKAGTGTAKAMGSAAVRWVTPSDLGEVAMPTAHRAIARALES